MESIAAPLRELHDDASWFARAKEVRLLRVRCDAAMRKSAIAVVAGMEGHAANRSPHVVLEDAWKTRDPGWAARALRFEAHWEERRRRTAEEGIELGAIAGPTATAPLAAFGALLEQALRALRPPLEGLVVVLAPARVEDGEAFEAELIELVRRRELQAVRWVIVDVDAGELTKLEALVRDELHSEVLHARCMQDDAAFTRDLSAMMSAADPLVNGPARVGAAWPRGVLPPQRKNEPIATDALRTEVEIELAAAGVNPVLAGPEGAKLQQYVLAAAVHMKAGNGELALQHQREACRIAHEALAGRELLMMWLVLAGYELALGKADDAERDYAGVAARASEEGFDLERAQALLALALIAGQRGRHAGAAAHYGEAAASALRAQSVGLAIECWRLAGHMAAEAKLHERAAECWNRAIELAEGADPNEAKRSSAPLAARQLAAWLRAQGLRAHADALEHQANRIEAGENRVALEARA